MGESLAASNETGRVVTVFRSHLREEGGAEYSELAPRMAELASSIPGFVEVKTFTADDGERASIVIFDSMEAHRRWRHHAEHRQAQRIGRERLYSEYRILVCKEMYVRDFERDE